MVSQLIGLVEFAKSSRSSAAVACGGVLLVLSALLGTSMLSLGHIAGSGLMTVGVVGLAREGRISELSWRPSRSVFLALWVFVLGAHALTAWAYYWQGMYAAFDVGVFADVLANFAVRGAYRSSVLGIHGLADHFTPSLMLFTPLFVWKPSFLWLIGAKIAAALACPPLLYLIGREVLGSASRWLWAMPCLHLVHTVFCFAYLFQFQPTHLAPPLALLCFWLALKERWLWLALSLLVLAGLKEDQALVGVCIGAFLVVERGRRRIGLGIATGSVVLGLAIFLFAMPAFSEGAPVMQHARFGPLQLWPKKLFLVATILATLGGLPLLHPRALLWTLGAFGVHFVSGFPQMLEFRYHYQAVPVTVTFVGALYGLATIQNQDVFWKKLTPRARAFTGAAMLATILSLNGMLPHFSGLVHWPTVTSRMVIEEANAMRSRLPTDRMIFAEGGLLPHLIPCAGLRDFKSESPAAAIARLGSSPHVVLMPTVVSIEDSDGNAGKRIASMRAIAKDRGYRVESPSPHLVLYWSPTVIRDGAPSRRAGTGALSARTP